MVSKLNSLQLTASFLVATSLFLSACQEGGHHQKVKVVPPAKSGTVVDGKGKLTAEEQLNTKDPTTLEPYKHILEPVFLKLNKIEFILWSDLARLKTWVIGPIDDKKDFSPAMASTTAEGAGYIAHQMKYEIFINLALYDKLNEEQQADLLLNEFLTSLYTLKSFKTEELCSLLEEKKLKIDNCQPKTTKANDSLDDGDLENIEELNIAAGRSNDRPQKVNPERKAALDRLDYDKIAIVKKFILEQRSNLNVEDLLTKMRANGFDMRIFSFKVLEGNDPNSNNHIGKQTIDSLFSQLQQLEKKSLNCHFLRLGETGTCKFQASRMADGAGASGKKSNYLNFAVKIDDETVATDMIYQSGKLKTVRLGDPGGKEMLYLVPLFSAGLQNRLQGQTYRMNYFVASKIISDTGAEQPWKLHGLLSAPGVVAEVYEEEANNEVRIKCKGSMMPLKEKNVKTDVLFLSETDKNIPALSASLGSIQVLPPCW